ncbi:hypothetical protein Ahy_A07g031490 [Arachis hypogaea]|uniref:Uncharacterized protein n=1 Tax=Arachis hypogaea TaxID=3818 RepID=A0A445C456_ARAHY|nr:hypothetical protein Ahy_A07g031490 [Arachis hypogaea]
MAARNQTKDLKCATHLLSDKFRNMTEEKKAIVRDLGFGGLMHIPPLRVDHQLLRELANNFKLGENRLRTGYGDLFPEKVEYKKLSDDDKIIYRRFQGKTLKSLTDDMMEIGVGNEKERLMFKRIFILYIQMAFLLPTTINKISPVHLAPIFKMDGISERNWGACFDLHGDCEDGRDKRKNEKKRKKTRNQKNKKRKASPTSSSETETTDSDTSTSESEAQEDSEDSGRKHPSKKGKKMDSRKRKQRQEESDSDSESESEPSDESEESSPAEKKKKKKKTKTTPKKTQQKKKKVVVEDSPPEEDQYFDGENQADLRSTEGRYVSSET